MNGPLHIPENYVDNYLNYFFIDREYFQYQRDLDIEEKVLKANLFEALLRDDIQTRNYWLTPSNFQGNSPPSIGEEFNLNPTFQDIRLSHLFSYRKKHKLSIDDAISQLSKEGTPLPALSGIKHSWKYEQYSQSINPDMRQLVRILQKKTKTKIFMPYATESLLNYFMAYSPDSEYLILPGLWDKNVTESKKIIIITDSLEIFTKNMPLSSISSFPILWISWYELREHYNSKMYDWSGLAGKDVYYLLYNHSGLSKSSIIKTAEVIRTRLNREVNINNFRYLCKYDTGSDKISRKFHVLSEDAKGDRAKFLWQELDNDISTYTWKGFSRKLLKYPMFYEGSTTILYGNCIQEMSMFSKLFAHSLSPKVKFIQGWGNHHNPIQTIYINGISSKQKITFPDIPLVNDSQMTFFYEIDLDQLNYKDGPGIKIQGGVPCIEKQAREHLLLKIRKIIDKHMTIHPTFLILDHVLPLLDLAGKQQELPFSNDMNHEFFQEMKAKGVTILLLANLDENTPKNRIQALKGPFENVIKATKLPSKEKHGTLRIQIEKVQRIEKGSKRSFLCQVKESKIRNSKTNDSKLRIKIIRGRIKSQSKWLKKKHELVETVLRLRNDPDNPKKQKEVAKELKIHLSLVKRICAMSKTCSGDINSIVVNSWKSEAKKLTAQSSSPSIKDKTS